MLFVSVVYYAHVLQLTEVVMLIKTNRHITLQGKLVNGLTPAYQFDIQRTVHRDIFLQ
jgi:hypothetical protein